MSKDPPSPQPQNGSAEVPGSSSELAHDEAFGHRYNQLSAMAQEKIKNFEQETKALLRRDVQKPRASVGTPQVSVMGFLSPFLKKKINPLHSRGDFRSPLGLT